MARPFTLAEVPEGSPRTGHAFGRWLGRTLLRLGGWRVTGAFPPMAKAVVIAAPHSSGWDAYWGIAAKLAMGIDIRFMAKAELFVGPLGWLLRSFGGIPTHRQAPGGLIGEMQAEFRRRDRLWLVIAPEGTRRKVTQWKSGFWRIAHEAGVPVVCAYFHYPDKVIGIGEVFTLTDDMAADMARIRAWYRPWMGKHRDTL